MDKLRILLLEDNTNDAELIISTVKSSMEQPIDIKRVETREDYLKEIKLHQPDLILSDYRLPQYDGLTALNDVAQQNPNIPFIIVTGSLTEEAAADAIKLGAWDYVVKERLFRLATAIQNVLKLKNERERQIAVAQALQQSEEKFRTLSVSAQDAIIIIDANNNLTFWNDAAEKIFQYSQDEVLFKNYSLLFTKGTAIKKLYTFIEHINKLDQKSKSESILELDAIKKNGSIFPVELSMAGLNVGGMMNTVLIIRDISARKASEIALKESEEKYRHLIENSQDAIFLSYKGVYEIVNDRFKQLFNINGDLPKKFDFLSHVDEDTKKYITEKQQQLGMGEKISPDLGFAICREDGSKVFVEASISLMKYKHGYATQGILRDISERKSLEEQFRQSQKMEVIGQLAGGVAHDFNNILTIINGYSDFILEEPELDERITENINQIKKAGMRAQALTNQLLAFSRKQITQIGELDLNAEIENSFKVYKRLIGEDIDVIFELDKDMPLLMADIHQIEQILMNLLINARDAIHEDYDGEKERTIVINTGVINLADLPADVKIKTDFDICARITISDSGVGMTGDIVNQIFDPFFTTKDSERGTGLGLSTVYGIVKQNGAEIKVNSKPHVGSTFEIFWPVAGTTESGKLHRAPESEIQRGTESILLVEDDEGVRAFTDRALYSLGYKVYSAINAERAMQMISEQKLVFDLLITDVVMPGVSGHELGTNIKEKYNVPVIFISGYTDNQAVYRDTNEIDYHFLQKPYNLQELSIKVRKALDVVRQ